ncbi:RNA helicase [Paramarasmius palmivorus]|uniref:RNA helicase n=1 Tax=Paramarasmius palmivorus TaxID=297713 RepID=A0AAW0DVQ6_9AGAR
MLLARNVSSSATSKSTRLTRTLHVSHVVKGNRSKPFLVNRSSSSKKLPRLVPTEFVRDQVPHHGQEGAQEGKGNPSSFRRKSRLENERDWHRRKGTWGDELKGVSTAQTPDSTKPSFLSAVARNIPKANRTAYNNRSAEALAESMPAEARASMNSKKYDNDKEFAVPTSSSSSLPTVYQSFSSPPLLPGLRNCLRDMLGPGANPTRIQALSINHVLPPYPPPKSSSQETQQWREWLLASETGSGKSIAYLLPVLQSLKLSELASSSPPPQKRAINPRALVLAPTHELSRQLSGFAKGLLHEVKLRVLCASRANNSSDRESVPSRSSMRASEMATMSLDNSGDLQPRKGGHPVDVVIGTPMKLLEMVRGRGWDRAEDGPGITSPEDDEKKRLRRGRDKLPPGPGQGRWRAEGEMGLENVEWVVVDEADVLFDPDFQETTRMLLADIAAARGKSQSASPTASEPGPESYPFNLLLTSATIPTSLSNYLTTHHPKMQQLVSPGVHKLPKTLKTEYVNWTGGNKMADIEKRLRQVWADDSVMSTGQANLSQVLIFCNKSSKVMMLSEYLKEKGIPNLPLTSVSETRVKERGSNRHLTGFLRPISGKDVNVAGEQKEIVFDNDMASEDVSQSTNQSSDASASDNEPAPKVLITTSLLSRGLDFSPSIKHVFIVDEPRNILDFIHRAGRSARAGQKGTVVIFGKGEGRGSGRAKEVRRRVAALK